MIHCPCGNPRSYDACCQPYLDGVVEAPTIDVLARARYTAYTRHHVDYLLRTYCPDRQYLFDRETTLEWARRSHFDGLEIRRVTGGQPQDAEGQVEFIAWYRRAKRTFRHHEVSQFRAVEGLWYYVDGRYPDSTALLGAESRRLKH